MINLKIWLGKSHFGSVRLLRNFFRTLDIDFSRLIDIFYLFSIKKYYIFFTREIDKNNRIKAPVSSAEDGIMYRKLPGERTEKKFFPFENLKHIKEKKFQTRRFICYLFIYSTTSRRILTEELL